jgi:hypothetical protein
LIGFRQLQYLFLVESIGSAARAIRLESARGRRGGRVFCFGFLFLKRRDIAKVTTLSDDG